MPDAPAQRDDPNPGGLRTAQIARVLGIRVRVHWSLLLALPFFAYFMAAAYFRPDETIPAPWAWLWGAVLALTLFLSVLLHEISHSLAARHYGTEVRGITLLPIGGVSEMTQMPERPRHEFIVSALGPLTNFVIAAPLLALTFFNLVPDVLPGLPQFVQWVGWINLVLGAFNLLIPGFPMDGGRLLRAMLAARFGFVRATRIAAGTGRVVAFVLGLLGLLAFTFGGLLLVLIALFIFAGAGAEEAMVMRRAALRGLTVNDLMTEKPVTLHPDDSLEDAFQTMQRTKHLGFPVVDGDQKLVGCLGLQELARASRDEFADARVGDHMLHDPVMVEADMPAADALQRLMAAQQHEHLLVGHEGHLDGILSRTDLERTLRFAETFGGHA